MHIIEELREAAKIATEVAIIISLGVLAALGLYLIVFNLTQ
jgi:hypothetical protein